MAVVVKVNQQSKAHHVKQPLPSKFRGIRSYLGHAKKQRHELIRIISRIVQLVHSYIVNCRYIVRCSDTLPQDEHTVRF